MRLIFVFGFVVAFIPSIYLDRIDGLSLLGLLLMAASSALLLFGKDDKRE